MIQRVYHNYNKLEEYHAGLWKIINGEQRKELLKRAIEFTGNTEKYGKYMLMVVDHWPYSCEHNLTCLDMNRQAWIGHAACCMAIQCPEDITRLAWHELSKELQDAANLKADHAISVWEDRYIKSKGLKNAKNKARNQLLPGF